MKYNRFRGAATSIDYYILWYFFIFQICLQKFENISRVIRSD